MKNRGETRTATDAPGLEIDEAFWDKAQPIGRDQKVHTGIRIDADVLNWFKAQGRGWQTRMNAVLRSYYEHRR